MSRTPTRVLTIDTPRTRAYLHNASWRKKLLNLRYTGTRASTRESKVVRHRQHMRKSKADVRHLATTMIMCCYLDRRGALLTLQLFLLSSLQFGPRGFPPGLVRVRVSVSIRVSVRVRARVFLRDLVLDFHGRGVPCPSNCHPASSLLGPNQCLHLHCCALTGPKFAYSRPRSICAELILNLD